MYNKTMVQLVDTHCHIQVAALKAGDKYMQEKWKAAGFTDPAVLIAGAKEAGVKHLICVGCTLKDSEMACLLAQKEASCTASIGIHPHEAKNHLAEAKQSAFAALATNPNVVAIGECGLDYFYSHSPKADQLSVLEFQLELAAKHNLPLILHVREAYDDFWPMYDRFKGLRGVMHSFSAYTPQLEQALSRGLYIGLNGIMTFTKDNKQLEAAKHIPLDKLLLETDAPFLTPVPFRGKICEPKHIVRTAEFLADLRGESLEELASATTKNAEELFNIQEF